MRPGTKNWLKKVAGIILILLGLISVLTPFTPFGWLILVGLGLLGVRIGFWEKIKTWLKAKNIL